MSRGKILNIFNNGLEEDNDFSHIQKEVKKNRKNKNIDKLKTNKILLPSQHLLFLKKEKRRGKIITMVGCFELSLSDKKDILKQLKKSLATGGTIKDDFLEFQGEVDIKLKELLIQKGFKFKN